MFIEWLNAEREVVPLPIDEIYCKHESNYDKYRNNYRNQLKSIHEDPIDYQRIQKLVKVLKETCILYPIAVYSFRDGYMCIDGHHRIKAYLTAGLDVIPAIVYKSKDEAISAKKIPYE